MAQYRCYFLGSDGESDGAENVDAEGERDAIQFCRVLCTAAGYRSFEVWQCDRRLHKETMRESV